MNCLLYFLESLYNIIRLRQDVQILLIRSAKSGDVAQKNVFIRLDDSQILYKKLIKIQTLLIISLIFCLWLYCKFPVAPTRRNDR